MRQGLAFVRGTWNQPAFAQMFDDALGSVRTQRTGPRRGKVAARDGDLFSGGRLFAANNVKPRSTLQFGVAREPFVGHGLMYSVSLEQRFNGFTRYFRHATSVASRADKPENESGTSSYSQVWMFFGISAFYPGSIVQ